MDSQDIRLDDGRIFLLVHENESDSRLLFNEDGNLVLTINSSLRITDANERMIGYLYSADDEWCFVNTIGQRGEVIQTGFALRDYHWLNLWKAEVAICKLYIEGKIHE